MVNTLLVPQDVATVAAKLVGLDLNLAGMLSRDLAAEFKSGKGDTVRVRVPGAVVARTKGVFDKTTPLETDEVTEQAITVTLNDHVYSKVTLSEGDLELNLESFARQILKPQTDAVVRHVERAATATMQATPITAGVTYDASNPARIFTALRSKLRANGVPDSATLYAAVGTQVYADLLDGPVGSTGTTFDASGKVRDFTVVESTRLAPDEIVGFVPEAFTLVVRAPEVPQGAPYGASVSAEGFALRHILAYDDGVAATNSTVSAFVEVAALPLAVDREDGTVDLVQHGGAVRVRTTAGQ